MTLGVFISQNAIIPFPLMIKTFHSPQGGYLWPMMFITMACGAISGFHSLVASGTTSKQLSKETDAKRIGYIGMLAEGMLAVLVILCIIIGVQEAKNVKGPVNSALAIKLFSQGFGIVTAGFLKEWGSFIAIVILNAFILTTLDTATRITRYVTQELFKISNDFLATAVAIGASLVLLISGRWHQLWQLFGASNQLLASFSLLVVSIWLLNKMKPYLFSLLPGVAMLTTSVAALVLKAIYFYKNKNFILLIISGILVSLGIFMFIEVLQRLRLYEKNKK